ncbi:MAG: hypothetical protein LBC12_01535 [Nitrososphaerota archaeon]|jgi:hypothetical protein|nr:hypothetical protein [Nitrososphaerota archaeon]
MAISLSRAITVGTPSFVSLIAALSADSVPTCITLCLSTLGTNTKTSKEDNSTNIKETIDNFLRELSTWI